LAKVTFGAVFLAAALVAMLASGRLFLGFGPEAHSLPMLVLVMLTAVGYLAPGMLVGAMTSRMRGRDAMLAVALLPLMIPLFLAATGAGQTIIEGGGFAGIGGELTILGTFTCLYLAAGAALFGRIAE
jgi:heme exporter protein B